MSRLVIFDMNGVLIDRVRTTAATDDGLLPPPPPDFTINQCHTWVRPEFTEILKYLKSMNVRHTWVRPELTDILKYLETNNIQVGIWSSMQRNNLESTVARLFPPNFLLFAWDQSYCTAVNNPLSLPKADGYVKPLFVKDLTKVWSAFPQYNASNTLLIDNDAEKCTINPPQCIFIIETWTRNTVGKDDNILARLHQFCTSAHV